MVDVGERAHGRESEPAVRCQVSQRGRQAQEGQSVEARVAGGLCDGAVGGEGCDGLVVR